MVLEQKELTSNLMFVMNLPWRGVDRMSGVLTDKQVMALIDIINRQKAVFENSWQVSEKHIVLNFFSCHE